MQIQRGAGYSSSSSPPITKKGTIVLAREHATCGRTVCGKTCAFFQLNPAQPPELTLVFQRKMLLLYKWNFF